MHHVRRTLMLSLALLSMAANPLRAQSVDCAAIRGSTIPYELEYRPVDNPSGGEVLHWQKFRDQDGNGHSYDRFNGQPGLYIIRSRFGINQRLEAVPPSAVTTEFSYEPPITWDVLASKQDFTWIRTMKQGATNRRARMSFSFREAREMAIGPCRFEVLSYALVLEGLGDKPAPTQTDTILYAPQLGTVLNRSWTVARNGATKQVVFTPVDIRTTFRPAY